MESIAVFLLCFLSIVAAGFVDTHHYNKTRRPSEAGENRQT